MREYYSIIFLEREILSNKSAIYRALRNYGYSNFSLEILEYCDPSEVTSREQYYIDLLNPEYNILKKAGSSLGFKHSEDTKAKFKARRYTPEQEAKRLERLKILNSSKNQAEHLKGSPCCSITKVRSF